MNLITQLVQAFIDDEIVKLNQVLARFSLDEILDIRFECDMNILNYAIEHKRINTLTYLAEELRITS